MFVFKPDIKMSEDEFRQIRDFIYDHCGLHFDIESKYMLEKRLNRRLTQLNLESFKDYYYQLRYSRDRDEELSTVIDLLTTNETYFFREDFQLKTFTDEIIPEIMQKKRGSGDRSLRIWSAGCSSGEEPYTIAMLLMQNPEIRRWNVEIIGTDISKQILSLAREGIYGKGSFRSTDDFYIDRYFTDQDGKLRISDQVKQLVSISHLNLLDQQRISLLGKMDAIFCRNVIIYFDSEAKKKVISSLHDQLHSGGFLLLGHSESLMNISTEFDLRHFTHDMVYQRPERKRAGGVL
ncbi:MCP methyltransferase, CheR-type [Malonomonas rubra DSM 5091]|uniref:protein-glutamate O-methyltransferase n=1 Tax=Malonomonas rubra DSM 5091 TaxID=1122189 RepID=A0A1M6DFY5_MALRU|nr:MCP methyltransferase, CheR-type [Malonomonas rubra DSM 5091]